MSERARFEAEELRGLAERYGGRRVPGRLGYTFSPLCWCCPHWDNDTMQPPEQEGDLWTCSRGCTSCLELKDCPNALPGHAGYRHVREAAS